MGLILIDNLPRKTRKGAILKWLIETGRLNRTDIGKIELSGNQGFVEIPDKKIQKLIPRLDGSSLEQQKLSVSAYQTIPLDPNNHFAKLKQLLALEAKAEIELSHKQQEKLSPKVAEKSGYSLINLTVRAEEEALGGHLMVQLGKRNHTQSLPWNRLRSGTPILLSTQEAAHTLSWRGVVTSATNQAISLSLRSSEQFLPPHPELLRLDIASDAISRRRQEVALERTANATRRLAELRDVLLQKTNPDFHKLPEPIFRNQQLNQSQKTAVHFALEAVDFAIIHGPPGTGKTTTIVELIEQSARMGHKILACAPSNIAVDNMLDQLRHLDYKVVRLGHPARVLPELQPFTLDLLVHEHPNVLLARKIRRQAFALQNQANKFTRARPAPGAKKEMRQESYLLLDEATDLEIAAVDEILDHATIICSTTNGLSSQMLGQHSFDLCIIDEAAQATEPESWIPILRSQKVVFAGDHQQLPATIISDEAARKGLAISLMEKLVTANSSDWSRQLNTQYRMHQQIMAFSSHQFYDDRLVAHPSVANHLLSDLPHIQKAAITETPLLFVDTAGAGFEETIEEDGTSRFNQQEAHWIIHQLNKLLELGVSPTEIALIAPYSAQVRFLRELIPNPLIEINSVDGFQGREKEVILISLVRSNEKGEIGFLADTRRLNVALTRARRKLMIIGDSATITTLPFYAQLIDYCDQLGYYRSIWEEDFSFF